MSDIDDNDNIDIDDEVLIAIVQQNPCLYAKSDANYKDHKVKEMKWKTISESLNCTADEAKKRWDSLRSQFSRKLRQQKIQPSGSGVIPEWPLMSCMSFLKSHIQNRKYVYI
ncbi:Transcription factor Adf-1 [Trachymyrmex cornetzi]|uniref:Transcription factor Adf-1 n=2 Tax=Trachymyrmex cornetzi TaxID=471704 RepID=A0A151ISL3_9HYME|nr:Transcription factor Adf-1 [Trachymyrmex cornetzi]